MKFLTLHDAAILIAKLMNKPVIEIGGIDLENYGFEEVFKAAPYLDFREDETNNKNGNLAQIVLDGRGIIICDDEEEQNHIYNLTVGDDGPTILNTYDGKASVYALTIDAKGDLVNENT